MNFAQEQRKPTKHVVGIGAVLVMHVLLGYALVSGLARKVVEVIKAPIETRIIEEVKPPPPPPENLPPPPKFAPPPSFMPPPEVVVNPPPAPAITTTTVAPPPAPVTIAPAPAPDAPLAPVGAQAVKAAVIDVSTCAKPSYPSAASRAEAAGVTKIRFTVDGTGKLVKADIEKSSGASREHKLLDRAAVEALSQCRFKPGTDEHGRPVGAFAVVDYVWKLE